MTETIDLAGDRFPARIQTDAAELLNPYRPAWHDDSLCSQTDPEAFYPEKGGSTKEAKRICAACPAQQMCLEWALANRERFGIWGGKSERERRILLSRREEQETAIYEDTVNDDERIRGPRVTGKRAREAVIRVAEEQGLPTSALASMLGCSADAASVARGRYRAKVAETQLRAVG